MKVQEPVDESVIDRGRGSTRHELLDDEADLAGIDDGFGWNRPASPESKPLGKGNGLAPEGSAIDRRVPLHDDRVPIRSDELVSPGFASAELPHEAEVLPCHLREDRSGCVGAYCRFTRHALSIALVRRLSPVGVQYVGSATKLR